MIGSDDYSSDVDWFQKETGWLQWQLAGSSNDYWLPFNNWLVPTTCINYDSLDNNRLDNNSSNNDDGKDDNWILRLALITMACPTTMATMTVGWLLQQPLDMTIIAWTMALLWNWLQQRLDDHSNENWLWWWCLLIMAHWQLALMTIGSDDNRSTQMMGLLVGWLQQW